MYLKFYIVVFVTILMTIVSCEDEVKVCLERMVCLVGKKMPSVYDEDNFEAFLGVPYAKPPVGDLRFRNPEPVESWQGDLLVNEAKADCKQRNYLMPEWPIMGDEDCLYMNIYRPNVEDRSPLPVLFYIYGGGLFSGSSNPVVIGPEYFMQKREVLVVVVNYRLGPFGFLSSGCNELPGNLGLKDQLLALRWINEHIAAFGGNPEEITLFGHGAGGSAAHFHMINPKTTGLFQRAILGSGNALAPFVEVVDKPLEQLYIIAEALGIESARTQTTQQLANTLRNSDADAILRAGDVLKFWFNHNLFNFRPVIENASDSNAYLIEQPYETIRKGNYELRPSLTGLVSYRGQSAPITFIIYEDQSWRNELNQNFDEKMMDLLDLKNLDILNELIDVYMQGIHELNSDTRNGFLELFSDQQFFHPVYRSLRYYFKYADVDKNPVYIYKFSYHGLNTYTPFYTGGPTNSNDVVHYDDLLYQFRQSALFPDFEKDSSDHQLSNEFVDILVEFIKTGKPLYYEDIGSCSGEQFLTSGPNSMCKYLEFVNSIEGSYKRAVSEDFHIERLKLWDKVMNVNY